MELDDGQKVRAQVIKRINDWDSKNHQSIKLLLKLGNGQIEELISYTDLNDAITSMIDDEVANPDRPFLFTKELLGMRDHSLLHMKTTRDLNTMLKFSGKMVQSHGNL